MMKSIESSILKLMKQSGLAPILIVILITILGIGGYFAYTSLRGSGEVGDVAISPSPTPISSTNPSDETANWKTYSGETAYTTDGSSSFTIKYPAEWLLEENKLYPFGKDDLAFNITLGASGHGGPKAREEKNFPAGIASYFWDKNDIAAGGYATFDTNGKSYIFEIAVPANKSSEYEEIFNQILSTFRFD